MIYHKTFTRCNILGHKGNKIFINVGRNDLQFNINELLALDIDLYKPGYKYLNLYLPYYNCVDPTAILNTTVHITKLKILVDAYNNDNHIFGKILYKLPGGYVVLLLNEFQVFLPLSQAGGLDLNDKIGEELSFKVLHINLKNGSIILRYTVSISIFSDLHPIGTCVKATIKTYNPKLGLFIQLKSLDSFIHNFCLPENFPTSGELNVYIAHIDIPKKRIYCTLKPLSVIEPGTILDLTVHKLLDTGILCTVEEGIYAYIRNQEFSWTSKVHQYAVGDKVKAALLFQTYLYHCSIKKTKLNLRDIDYDKVHNLKLYYHNDKDIFLVQCGEIKIKLDIKPWKDMDITANIKDYLKSKIHKTVQVLLSKDEETKMISAELHYPDVDLPDHDYIISSITHAEQTGEYTANEDNLHNISLAEGGWTIKYGGWDSTKYTDPIELLIHSTNPINQTLHISLKNRDTTIGDLL